MDNINYIAFVYQKDGKIKCLDYNTAYNTGNGLIAEGWKRIATIDPCKAIEWMYNEKKSAKKYFK